MPALWDPVIVYDSTESAYWEAQTVKPGTVKTPLAAAGLQGTAMTITFSRAVASGIDEDLAMTTYHLAVEAGPGVPMSAFDSADAARVQASWYTNVWLVIRPWIANDWQYKDAMFRNFGANFPLDKNGVSKPGPTWLVSPANSLGGGTDARLPDQVALTVTYRTASRKHWGRNYLGGITTAALADTAFGHPIATCVDAFANAHHTWLKDLADDARVTNLWVWSPRYRGACSVDELSVDDVFDVVRRRRAKHPTYRKTFTS